MRFRNKNATTASRHMGMPVPDRPHALVRHCTVMLHYVMSCYVMLCSFSLSFLLDAFHFCLFSSLCLHCIIFFFHAPFLFLAYSFPSPFPDLHLLPLFILFFLILTFSFLILSLCLPFPPPLPSSLLQSLTLKVFGSHEDDLLMTEGSSGLKEQITVGFLELADDLTQRLPVSCSYPFYSFYSMFCSLSSLSSISFLSIILSSLLPVLHPFLTPIRSLSLPSLPFLPCLCHPSI